MASKLKYTQRQRRKGDGFSETSKRRRIGACAGMAEDVCGGGGAAFVRADKIDLKSMDEQLDRHITRVLSMEKEKKKKQQQENGKRKAVELREIPERQSWELDSTKLLIKSKLARGTFGFVYSGVYDGEEVSVKLLDWGEEGQMSRAAIAGLRTAFAQEVSVWHKLDHPNVTKFVGAKMGTSKINIQKEDGCVEMPRNVCCVVVEYLAEGTLKDFLIRHARTKLAFKVVIQLATDLARGLSYLHSKKIVHRDVKTENMLITNNQRVKIAGFGVSRVEANEMTGETGTVGYMAPEVLNGHSYDRKCDVYSFGICLWEIYCCDMPYPDLSFTDFTSAVVNQNLRPDIPRCCPSSVATIMKRCWDANAGKRPQMDEVVSMLEAIDTSKGGGMIPSTTPQGCFCFRPQRGP